MISLPAKLYKGEVLMKKFVVIFLVLVLALSALTVAFADCSHAYQVKTTKDRIAWARVWHGDTPCIHRVYLITKEYECDMCGDNYERSYFKDDRDCK